MGGSSMSSIMLMATMVVLSWRSSMMERHTILMLFIMDTLVVDIYNAEIKLMNNQMNKLGL